MHLEYLGIYLLLFVSPVFVIYADEDHKDQDVITECDREIGGIMCEQLKKKICDCADDMPDDEKPIFYNCAKELELTDAEEWEPFLDAVCDKKSKRVETAHAVIRCWEKQMNETVHQMESDKVYPTEFFECQDRVFNEAVDKGSCPCQTEKRNKPCSSAPDAKSKTL